MGAYSTQVTTWTMFSLFYLATFLVSFILLLALYVSRLHSLVADMKSWPFIVCGILWILLLIQLSYGLYTKKLKGNVSIVVWIGGMIPIALTFLLARQRWGMSYLILVYISTLLSIGMLIISRKALISAVG